MRRISTILIFLAVLASGLTALAQDRAIPRTGISLAAELDVQRVLLAEDLERYERLAERRTDLAARLTRIYRTLDGALQNEEEGSLDRIETLTVQIGEMEGERTELLASQRLLVNSIRDRQRTVALIEEALSTMPNFPRKVSGPLVGSWDVMLMPAQQGGTFILQQTGTLISGTYTLDGGWEGSLQGTLVNRKIYLVRIDSKKGRMMELEGYLAADGINIRGTWLSYEVLGGDGSRGQWSAEKREPGN
jgi:hypothetical protein